MSVAVTEPKSVPVSPAGTSKRSSAPSSVWRDLLGLLEGLSLVPRALLLVLAQLRDLGRRRRLGELPRQQVVAGEPRGDVHDLAAQAELLDVLSEDDLHA